ncbi:hypothetical protein TcG_10785 [Trypanosoma cruzi]|nr:hypothetical protein TcG_10785 [Trypanosoma cruzi]
MQEPQGHLNCVQHKLISAVDAIFLQCRRRDPVIVYLVQFCGVRPVQPLDVRLAFALVALCFRENKFKSFHVRDSGDTAMNNSAEYYRLVEEERGDGGGIGGSSRRVSFPWDGDTRSRNNITPANDNLTLCEGDGGCDRHACCLHSLCDRQIVAGGWPPFNKSAGRTVCARWIRDDRPQAD